MRLAESVAHDTDWRRVIDDLGHDKFNEWCAKDQLEPIGHGTRMLGYIASLLTVAFGGKHSEDELRAAFTPWVADDDQTPQPTHEDIARLADAIGLG